MIRQYPFIRDEGHVAVLIISLPISDEDLFAISESWDLIQRQLKKINRMTAEKKAQAEKERGEGCGSN